MEAETLIIREGKFYRGGSPVKPEFGNAEQIECLKQYETLGDILKEGMIVDNIQYDMQPIDATASFKCICGRKIYVNTEADEEDDIVCFKNKKVSCNTCLRSYIFDINNDHDLVVKIQN